MQHPDIHIFNPTCELAIANDSVSYMPPTLLRQFEKDLAYILLWTAQPLDMVVCEAPPSIEFQNLLSINNIQTPNFQTLKEIQNQSIPIHNIKPWGWSRALHHSIKHIKNQCDTTFQLSPNARWQESNKLSFSRLLSTQLIQKLLPEIENNPIYSIPQQPIVIQLIEQAYKALETLNKQSVFKTIWSSSGRGVLMVDLENNRLFDEVWIKSGLKQQGTLIAEPFLNKLIDLSFHFNIEPSGEITYLGHTFFKTDNQGKFKGCYLESHPNEIFDQPACEQLQEAIDCTPAMLLSALKELSIHQYYSGPVGIDTIWHQTQRQTFALHPAIEVNQRRTMGYVNLFLRKQFHLNATGYWEIAQFEPGGFEVFCKSSKDQNPTQYRDNKTIRGFIPLTPETGRFGAWLFLK